MPYGDSLWPYDVPRNCVVCGKPVTHWRGAFNEYRTPLCTSLACKRQRKLRLQAARRAQARSKEV